MDLIIAFLLVSTQIISFIDVNYGCCFVSVESLLEFARVSTFLNAHLNF